jgi:hypothetical protein
MNYYRQRIFMELQLPHLPRTVKLLPTPYLPSFPSVNLFLYSSVGSDNHMLTSASDKRFGLADTRQSGSARECTRHSMRSLTCRHPWAHRHVFHHIHTNTRARARANTQFTAHRCFLRQTGKWEVTREGLRIK